MEGSGHKGQRPTSSIHRWWWRWEFVAFCLYSISVGKGKLQKICCSLDTRVNLWTNGWTYRRAAWRGRWTNSKLQCVIHGGDSSL